MHKRGTNAVRHLLDTWVKVCVSKSNNNIFAQVQPISHNTLFFIVDLQSYMTYLLLDTNLASNSAALSNMAHNLKETTKNLGKEPLHVYFWLKLGNPA